MHAGFGKRPEETDRSSRTGTAPQADFHRPATAVVVGFIDSHRVRFGVEPICRVLTEHGCKIAPSTYYAVRRRAVSDRTVRDAVVLAQVRHVHATASSAAGSTGPVRSGTSCAARAVSRGGRSRGARSSG